MSTPTMPLIRLTFIKSRHRAGSIASILSVLMEHPVITGRSESRFINCYWFDSCVPQWYDKTRNTDFMYNVKNGLIHLDSHQLLPVKLDYNVNRGSTPNMWMEDPWRCCKYRVSRAPDGHYRLVTDWHASDDWTAATNSNQEWPCFTNSMGFQCSLVLHVWRRKLKKVTKSSKRCILELSSIFWYKLFGPLWREETNNVKLPNSSTNFVSFKVNRSIPDSSRPGQKKTGLHKAQG